MRSPGWLLRPLLLALAPLALGAAAEDQTQWLLSSFTWVKRVPAEAGAPPNAQPVQVGADTLRALLAPVQVRVDRRDRPLFGPEELKELAPALSEALALARPGEDLVLLSTSRHGGGFLEASEGLTARLFVQGDALHLLVQEARLDFLPAYQLMHVQPTFGYGSRQAASKAVLQAPRATRLRPDWLAFPLAAPGPAPLPVRVPAPAAPPRAAPEPPPTAAEAAAYEAKAQRLRTLKRLWEEHLLSDAEYAEKRDALLKAL